MSTLINDNAESSVTDETQPGVRPRQVTLREVARAAGVSLGTASNVLARRAHVAAETREHVISIAASLGYEPKPRAAATTTPSAITVLVRELPSSLIANPFYSHVVHGARLACAARGVSIMPESIAWNPGGRVPLPTIVNPRQVDGVLVIGHQSQDVIDQLQETGLPFVLVDFLPDVPIADVVHSDDLVGGYEATRHLIDHGHLAPPPACICGQLQHTSLRDRLIGYQRALQQDELVAPEEFVQIQPPGREFDFDHGRDAMLRLLDLPVPPTAVFCTNDMFASGALEGLRARGVRVPADCSVVGFDDTYAERLIPPLTTVRVDKALLGAQGVRHLFDRIADPDMSLRFTRVAVTLISRMSVGPRDSASSHR